MKGTTIVSARGCVPYRPKTRSVCVPKATFQHEPENCGDLWSRVAIGFISTAALSLSVAFGPAELDWIPAQANLPTGVTITSSKALLRNALPINNKPIRTIQRELENIDEIVRIPGNTGFGQVTRAAKKSLNVVSNQQAQILSDVKPADKAAAEQNLAKLKAGLPELIDIVNRQDKNEVLFKQQELLEYVGAIEEIMVKEFPFQVPSEYNNLPQLKGRAVVDMKVRFKEKFRGDVADLKIVVDGYNAPVTSGCFIDLVQKKFYDNMEIQRADGFVVQTGKPNKGDFYVDPKTDQPRKIPLEIHVATDKEPLYEFTLEDLGRFNEQPALPFNAYGTIAMARSEFDNNSASSQFFFLLKESELTPAGSNLLDGRYAVFGYVVDGQDELGKMKVGDVIESMSVVEGGENLKQA